MIIDAIRLYNTADDNPAQMHLDLSLDETSLTDSYLLSSASGLDADEIMEQFYAISGSDLKYHNFILPERNVALRIKLNPQYSEDETFSTLRDAMYKLISFNRRGDVELRFMNGATEVASLFGFVRKFEASLFQAEPEIQMTFCCPDPFLRSRLHIDATSLMDKPTSEINDLFSTAPHGFKFQITFTDDVPGPLYIQGIAGSSDAPFSIDWDFEAGSSLWFSSEKDDAYLYTDIGVGQFHLMHKLSLDSIWPIMFPGETRLTIPTIDFEWVDFSYKHAYWGV